MTEHQPATCEKCKCQKPDVRQAKDVLVPIGRGKDAKMRGRWLCGMCWVDTKATK